MTINKATKEYAAALKEARTVIENLEADARELNEKVSAAHDAENLLEDTQRGLDNCTTEKTLLREGIQEADLTGEQERADYLKEQYRELVAEEKRLQGEREQLTKVIENNQIDRSEIAEIRAQLRRVNAGGSTLVDAVRKAVDADTEALTARARAVEDTLPEGDDLELLYALGFTKQADDWKEAYEKNVAINENSGPAMREELHRRVQRVLARA